MVSLETIQRHYNCDYMTAKSIYINHQISGELNELEKEISSAHENAYSEEIKS